VNFSAPFIRRPIGTTLMAIGLFLVGAVAYAFLPVASLPSVEFPTINVTASRPGADPNIMAATVAAPIERRLGEISGVTELTSVTSLGQSRITIQFDLSRSIEGAARDVQAALNAALSDLPTDLPTLPTFRKANFAAAPILILALTSKTMHPSAIYDAADSIIAQRLSQVSGVADVTVAGSEQPAVRVRVDPTRLSAMGLSMEDVRTAISNANAAGPLGTFDGDKRAVTIGINDQLWNSNEYDPLVVSTVNGTVIRLSNIASIRPSVRNSRAAGWFNRDPSVLLIITKQADANVIDTVDRIYSLLPELRQWVPAGLEISVLSDRTQTIRASVRDMQLTLAATVVLVMLVVFLFLRRAAPTAAAGVTVPLALSGTCAAMWAAGFSIDNLSLMALAVSVGFVVDDAIVMIENAFRHLEKGASPLRATLQGAKQIGFTVVAISVSLVAAFIPLLFMGGLVGRLFREFSVTLAFAIAISTVVSLSVTFLQVLTSAMAAYAFARLQFRGRNALFVLFLATLMVPFQVMVVPLFIELRYLGLLNSMAALIVPEMAMPFGVFLLRQAFLSLPRELEEAAFVDGAGHLRVFFRLVLPLSKPAIATVAVFSFMGSWNNFLWPLVVINNPDLMTLPLGLASMSSRFVTDWNLLLAGATISILPIVALFVFAQRYVLQGVSMSGLKG